MTVIKKTDKLVTPNLNIAELKNELIYIRDFAGHKAKYCQTVFCNIFPGQRKFIIENIKLPFH